MSIFCRSGILVSRVCQSSSLLGHNGAFRGLSSLRTARHHLVNAHLSSCQQSWRLPCRFDTHRCFSDIGEKTHSESSDTFEDTAYEMDDNSRHSRPQSRRSPETFNLDVLVSLLRQENAVDICVIKVPENVAYSEYFIVASGISPRHLRAMGLYAIKVYKFMKKDSDPNVKIEGKDAEDWMCIDFGNMIVHFMLQETREEYELEKLWTLRAYDEQLQRIPAEKLPEDFILDLELTK
ncbi:mitochondrial assembly of ribosomal large subunit protein 1 [Cololabis saira]|uniref:mitochondrial assembly of ribosomal large subunit protein 1 n=1 Tax=Cololabis saira TaxID=129043 RepID=UPI002AD262A6|nr:mitochondrial assembly of ribosomal large subunit protein 1 [Cololabis saira]